MYSTGLNECMAVAISFDYAIPCGRISVAGRESE